MALVEAAGRKAVSLPGNLTDEAFCNKLIETSREVLGELDILVNVAGKQTAVDSIADITTEQFDATFRANVYAMFWLCKAAIPFMPPGSTIINTTSIQSYNPSPPSCWIMPPLRQPSRPSPTCSPSRSSAWGLA